MVEFINFITAEGVDQSSLSNSPEWNGHRADEIKILNGVFFFNSQAEGNIIIYFKHVE